MFWKQEIEKTTKIWDAQVALEKRNLGFNQVKRVTRWHRHHSLGERVRDGKLGSR